ncbi:MAG: alpha/beta fold hydrolase [Gammaproteobacteria bacterium]|nr:alpha/beta fold hydrolase [Gammaproteobacteria bacterium]NNJ79736.1 alpha/beta fold hydrolase [Xanthomonadales bacterium]
MPEKTLGFTPPWSLRSGHLQSLLGSSFLRRRAVLRRSSAMQEAAAVWTLDGGEGIRLQGYHSSHGEGKSRGLAVLLHGWEGNVNSNYILGAGSRLFDAGYDVFRLNFRDHGDTHHLNPGLFHSCRLGEVVHALADLQNRLGARRWGLAGYSLGGNFSLRVGLKAGEAGLDIGRIVAICPVIKPVHAMDAMERGIRFYEWYFDRKWTRSLLAKKKSFPELYGDSTWHEIKGLRKRTHFLAIEHGYADADEYFEGYSVANGRLEPLTVSSTILAAEDDPICPVSDFHDLPDNPNLELLISRYGGHCSFLKNWNYDSAAEDLVLERFEAMGTEL